MSNKYPLKSGDRFAIINMKIRIGESDVDGFDSSTVVTKTISVYYKEDVVTFDIMVQEALEPSGNGSTGCCSSFLFRFCMKKIPEI